MNVEQFARMMDGTGFIAALDQSGGSTPRTLANYGIPEDSYSNDDEMFARMHKMRSRIIKSPSFTKEHILGAIIFEDTLDRTIEGLPVPTYLWEKKGIVPFLKTDKGLADEESGVQLMKPFVELASLLERAVKMGIFGTKMRSVIKEANQEGIAKLVEQQFEIAKIILKAGLVPIIEPEVDIHSKDKQKSENILKQELFKQLALLAPDDKVMFKLSIPSTQNFYNDLQNEMHVVRIVALSGGYSQKEAVTRLAKNNGIIASFSRALVEKLHVEQSEDEFDTTLKTSIKRIYEASIT